MQDKQIHLRGPVLLYIHFSNWHWGKTLSNFRQPHILHIMWHSHGIVRKNFNDLTSICSVFQDTENMQERNQKRFLFSCGASTGTFCSLRYWSRSLSHKNRVTDRSFCRHCHWRQLFCEKREIRGKSIASVPSEGYLCLGYVATEGVTGKELLQRSFRFSQGLFTGAKNLYML